MSCFICPVCRSGLSKNEKTYTCDNGHSFDIAKSGYVNLLMLSGKGKQHGDDREMIRARSDFLNRGFYDKLSLEICKCAGRHCDENVFVIDAGCGECKYTADVCDYLEMLGKQCTVSGIDISKDALSAAKQRSKKLHLAVASSSAMPVGDAVSDILINIFSPFCGEEFRRVLKSGGVVIRAYPLARHLWELKELIYDTPYENPEPDMTEQGFEIIERISVKYKMELSSNSDVKSLFKMTPYYYRTGEDDKAKLEKTKSLICSAEFGIVVYKKTDE